MPGIQPPFRAGQRVQDKETGEQGVVRVVDGTYITIEMPCGRRLVRFWDASEKYRKVIGEPRQRPQKKKVGHTDRALADEWKNG